MFEKVAIIGAGNIGLAIANGLVFKNVLLPQNIFLTRKNIDKLKDYKEKGFKITTSNIDAVKNSQLIIISVRPEQAESVFKEIAESLKESYHIIVSVVTGFKIERIKKILKKHNPVVRVMPNTAIAIGESMTCIASDKNDERIADKIKSFFSYIGETIIIDENDMSAATVLCACGLAFFLRMIRASSQGGIQIGFHSKDAIRIAAATARGAASLILNSDKHPEEEIDKVTTPKGITIEGLNQMEHEGLSSAIIKGIVASYNKAFKIVK